MNKVIERCKALRLCFKFTNWCLTKSQNEFIEALNGLKDDFSRGEAVKYAHDMVWSEKSVDIKLRSMTYGTSGWVDIHKYASKLYAEKLFDIAID